MLVPLIGIRDSGYAIRTRRLTDAAIVIRTASADDADAIHELIDEHLTEGHLLPRELGDILVHAHRFVVAVQDDEVLACADLAPLSHAVAEVRSMVVTREARGGGVGRRIVNELVRRATAAGFEKLCAFTHAPAYFIHMGFSIVPHSWLLEKVFTDCLKCPHFRQCGQYAMVVPLDSAFDAERGYAASAPAATLA